MSTPHRPRRDPVPPHADGDIGDQPAPDPAPERLADSVGEAARLTGLSRVLLYDEMRRSHPPYVKVGRRLITRQHLQEFLGVASAYTNLIPGTPTQKLPDDADINDTTMTSDQTAHTARPGPGHQHRWEMFRLPGQILNRNTTISAMTIAGHAAQAGLHEGHRLWPDIQGRAAELGLTAPDAIAQASQPPRHEPSAGTRHRPAGTGKPPAGHRTMTPPTAHPAASPPSRPPDSPQLPPTPPMNHAEDK
jgi:hypothetical protein